MAGALQQILEAAGRAIASAPRRGALTAYHFSPYKFDRFDLSKLGTGEGNFDYGRGLYVAENPDVVDWYKKTLGGGSGYRYKVDVGAHPDSFLDWDNYLKNQGLDPDTRVYQSLSPSELVDLQHGLGDIGSPGIRYFDARSRRAGAGTRNYVVGNDQLLNILGLYAHGGLI